jgi:hypothetical protein
MNKKVPPHVFDQHVRDCTGVIQQKVRLPKRKRIYLPHIMKNKESREFIVGRADYQRITDYRYDELVVAIVEHATFLEGRPIRTGAAATPDRSARGILFSSLFEPAVQFTPRTGAAATPDHSLRGVLRGILSMISLSELRSLAHDLALLVARFVRPVCPSDEAGFCRGFRLLHCSDCRRFVSHFFVQRPALSPLILACYGHSAFSSALFASFPLFARPMAIFRSAGKAIST